MADEISIQTTLAQIGFLEDDLRRLIVNTKKKGVKNFTVQYLQERLNKAQSFYNQIRELNAKLYATISEKEREKIDYFMNNKFGKTCETFDEIEEYLNFNIEKLTPPAEQNTIESSFHNSTAIGTSLTNQINIRLPQIDLPQFDGNYENWPNFRDHFTTIIHDNPNLNGIQKFHYLNSTLQGEAKRIIKALAITTENYLSAWNILFDRYQNERILISTLLNKITEISPVTKDNLKSLKSMRDNYQLALDSLNNLNLDTSNWDPILIHILIAKFDDSLRTDWERSLATEKIYPKLSAFNEFLQSRICALEAMQITVKNSKSIPPSKGKSNNIQHRFKTLNTAITPFECSLCKQNHKLSTCKNFLAKSVRDRFNFVKDKKLCVNCLGSTHFTANCKSEFTCRKCRARHHSLLHFGNTNITTNDNSKLNTNTPRPSTSASPASPVAINLHSNDHTRNSTILATTIVRIGSSRENTILVRALIDQGSETSFVSERVASALALTRDRLSATITGLGGETSKRLRYVAHFSVFSRDFSTEIPMQSFVISKITNYVSKGVDINQFPEFEGLELADSFESIDSRIELLIGVDYLPAIFTGNIIKTRDNRLLAQSSIFGWIVSGNLNTPNISNRISTNHCCQLENQLQRFWETEEVPFEKPMSEEDFYCEKLFKETTVREQNGRFIVKLPFKSESAKNSLGFSRQIAINSFRRIQKRFSQDTDLKGEYINFMSEYKELDHMSSITEAESKQSDRVFLPHHAVFRESDDQRKIRVVFNASSKTSNGVSLNDTLLVGPKLQQDITSILLNWRSFKFVFTTDLVKMFRQILLAPEDRVFQNIVWQGPDSEQIDFFELKTITYGLASAPYLAMRVIKELIEIYNDKFTLISRDFWKNIYVDDLLLGEHTIETLLQLKEQLIKLFAHGKFKLSKWSSNVESRSEFDINSDCQFDFTEADSNIKKILGISWDSKHDFFYYSFFPSNFIKLTKRIILSEISRIYDPLGWLSPLTIRTKQFMQLLWLNKTTWDEELPINLTTKWNILYEEFKLIHEITITRWIGYSRDVMSFQLVGFCDASTLSYSAVVYSRITDLQGKISVSLLMAKTKVAPLKTESIPRLELRAAALLVDLIKHIQKSLEQPINGVFCYSDSQVTLAWLAKHPSNWHIFVANRVSHIQTTLPNAKWGYVKSKSNPADLNSRGINANELIHSDLWWKGPEFLYCETITPCHGDFETDVELKKQAITFQVSCDTDSALLDRFSSWPKMLRVVCYVLRFISQARQRFSGERHSLQLQPEEIRRAKIVIIGIVQNRAFYTEIKSLQRTRRISNSSSLISLSPFLDEKGILRLGGRLKYSLLPENRKYPIILPQCHISDLLIRHHHLISLHGGIQLTINTIRQEYWILNCRNSVKSCIHNCTNCNREKARLSSEYMSSLPPARCTPSRVFSNSGVDMAGPFLIRNSKGRGHASRKSYLIIFVCLATRAVHLEIVTGCDAPSFLAAFDRFAARRGLPAHMYSDNGRNFVAGNRELKSMFKAFASNIDMHNELASRQVHWHFIPPASPHFGGLWEAGVKSVKYHLKRVIGKFIPTWEEFLTIATRVEACLNSRPICKIHDNPDNLEMLTPGHFLIGTSLLTPPENSYLDLVDNRLSRWQTTSKIVQQFWKIWSNQYLATLQSRSKWRQKTDNLKIGDIVIIKDQNNPPCQWTIGRILQKFIGNDDVCRVVSIQTPHNVIKRNITQICKLLSV